MRNNKYFSNALMIAAVCAFTLAVLSPVIYIESLDKDGYITQAERPARSAQATREAARFVRNDDAVDFSGVSFSPWDVNEASALVEKRAKKPYTIMIYMNGSDLESEEGAATDDLIEMLESGLESENANIVLFTGGTNRWQNDVIPENECAVWEIADGLLYEISGVGLVNMGNAGTLSSFIDFGVNSFPAEKYGLIMWDHGGGSIAGYGHDEKFNEDNLTLLDMNYAFKRSALSDKKLEFLGFDSCLMATAEMAAIAAPYSKYLIASEDLEPGGGWNYAFLSALNKNPSIEGGALGKEIVDSFMEYYGRNSDEILTLSVTDLSKIPELAGALETLMARCSESLSGGRNFNSLARRRNGTKTFGEGSPRDNDCDMVDIGDMALKLSDLFPEEAAEVIKRLNACVVYNRHNSRTDLKGLSAYYIYGGKETGRESLSLYNALKTNDEYSKYLDNFFGMLVSGSGRTRSAASSANESNEILNARLTLWEPLENEPGAFIMTGLSRSDAELSGDGAVWPSVNGQNVCLYEINETQESAVYVVPITRNGKDCDIIIQFSQDSPEGRILGTRSEDGLIKQKGFDELKKGDKIGFYFEKRRFSAGGSADIGWHLSEEITVSDGLVLSWERPNPSKNSYLSITLTDVKENRRFTGLIPARPEGDNAG